METNEAPGMLGRGMVPGFAVLPGEERLTATPMENQRTKTSILLAALNSPPGTALSPLSSGNLHHASSMNHAATPPASPPESLAGDSNPASPEAAGPASPPPHIGTRSPSPTSPSATSAFTPSFLTAASTIPTPLTSPRGESAAAAAVPSSSAGAAEVPVSVPTNPATGVGAVHPPDSARLGSNIFRPNLSHALPGKPEDALLNPSGHRGVKVLGGKYLLVERDEGNNMHRCIDVRTSKEYCLKVSCLWNVKLRYE